MATIPPEGLRPGECAVAIHTVLPDSSFSTKPSSILNPDAKVHARIVRFTGNVINGDHAFELLASTMPGETRGEIIDIDPRFDGFVGDEGEAVRNALYRRGIKIFGTADVNSGRILGVTVARRKLAS